MGRFDPTYVALGPGPPGSPEGHRDRAASLLLPRLSAAGPGGFPGPPRWKCGDD